MMKQSIHGLNQRTDIGFRTRPANSNRSRLRCQLTGQVHRNHQDRNLGMLATDLAGYIEAVQIRHLKI